MPLHPIPEDEVFLMHDLEDPIRPRTRRGSSTRLSKYSKKSRRDTESLSQLKMLWLLSKRIFWAVVSFVGLLTLSTLTLQSLPQFQTEEIPPWHRPSLFTNYFTHGVTPVPCHSHNDYWRRVPLFSALAAGCTSIEADIWPENDILRVGHTRNTILRGQSLHSLYLNPLLEILDQHNHHQTQSHKYDSDSGRNGTFNANLNTSISNDSGNLKELTGIFATSPSTSLTLLIDFKTKAEDSNIWDLLQKSLQPLRERGYLTYTSTTDTNTNTNTTHSTSTSTSSSSTTSNTAGTRITRPITIVLTGHAPFNHILSNPHKDIYYDAPLHTLEHSPSTPRYTYNASNSYYASTNFHASIGPLPLGRLTQSQLAKLRNQIRAARERGLKVRYWGTPAWPVSLRNYVWRVLVREGVDVLNVDDLRGATRVDWTRGWW